jgi:hypothetical protein
MSDEPMANGPKPGPKPSAGRGAGRGVKIALGVSLAANLLIVGLVVGAVLAVGPGRSRGDDPGLRSMGLGPFAIALSRDDRDAVGDRIDRDALRDTKRTLGLGLVQLRAALLQDPFDRPAAEAALSQARVAAASLQAQGHQALLDQIETMSLSDRTALADRLGRALRRMGGRDTDQGR